MTLADVVAQGPIVAADEDTGVICGANGSYFNFFVLKRDGGYECIDFVSTGKSMYDRTAADFWDAGRAALKSYLHGDEEDGDDVEDE